MLDARQRRMQNRDKNMFGDVMSLTRISCNPKNKSGPPNVVARLTKMKGRQQNWENGQVVR